MESVLEIIDIEMDSHIEIDSFVPLMLLILQFIWTNIRKTVIVIDHFFLLLMLLNLLLIWQNHLCVAETCRFAHFRCNGHMWRESKTLKIDTSKLKLHN